MPINILMPALSPTMTDGTLARWLKKEGDAVKSGDVIAEIETDKATMEVESIEDGTIGKILVGEGTEGVAVNAVIAILLEEGESAADLGKAEAPKAAAKTESKPDSAPAVAAPAAAPATTNTGSRVFASPLARRLAEQKGVDLKSITGSGPHGRIVKDDILGAKSAPQAATPAAKSAPTSSSPDAKALADMLGMKYAEVKHSGMRKVIASRLTESKQTIPHFYLSVDCKIDNLLALRKELNDKPNADYKLSVNDFVLKAVAAALKAYPAANVAWTDTALLQYEDADVSVAVSTPTGLITPIIKAAQNKGLREISAEMKDLAKRARDGKLKPSEYQGGTFSVSNLGMFGVKNFQAIVNPPQACILAVGAGFETAIIEKGQMKIATVMNCTLSVDHRAVDGAVGAEFLQYFQQYIENPAAMLL
jgi:pyruvate dehydrogenase E2 component (dihydrolipoamide acetyltransferase)